MASPVGLKLLALMACKILDLDLENLPAGLSGLKGYDKALILVRYGRVPVGQLEMPVAETGQIAADELRAKVLQAVAPDLWKHWGCACLGLQHAGARGRRRHTATVAVCTRDRADDLRRCLDALMRLPDEGQEYLVVDNAPSTDATYRLVSQYPRVRYVREAYPGLNAARNRALREARHEIVAFIDDDATADEHWLRALLSAFDDPLVLCVTGLTMPLEIETEAQEVFERVSGFARRGFRRRVFKLPAHNPVVTGPVGAGANMALRRTVTEKVGLFDEALDAGTPTHSGGDHEMFSRILSAGYRIVYEPAALNWHRHRRSQEELRRTIFGYGVGVYAAWTRSLLVEREWGVLQLAYRWFRHEQFPRLVRVLLGRSSAWPLDLVLAELKGCAVGPFAYMRARQLFKKKAYA